MSKTIWTEKYRPTKLRHVISQDNIVEIFREFKNEEYIPNMIIHGPSGVGKTSLIDTSNKVKFIILDEADAMLPMSQFSLGMELFTNNVRFCFICNHVNNLIDSIKSKCIQFNFSSLSFDDVKNIMKKITKREKLHITDDSLDIVIKFTNADMRLGLNILQSLSNLYGAENIDSNIINKHLGLPSHKTFSLIRENLLTSKFEDAYKYITETINSNGYYIQDIIRLVHEWILNQFMTNKIKSEKFCKLILLLSDLDYKTSIDSINNLLIAHLISIFIMCR